MVQSAVSSIQSNMIGYVVSAKNIYNEDRWILVLLKWHRYIMLPYFFLKVGWNFSEISSHFTIIISGSTIIHMLKILFPQLSNFVFKYLLSTVSRLGGRQSRTTPLISQQYAWIVTIISFSHPCAPSRNTFGPSKVFVARQKMSTASVVALARKKRHSSRRRCCEYYTKLSIASYVRAGCVIPNFRAWPVNVGRMKAFNWRLRQCAIRVDTITVKPWQAAVGLCSWFWSLCFAATNASVLVKVVFYCITIGYFK